MVKMTVYVSDLTLRKSDYRENKGEDEPWGGLFFVPKGLKKWYESPYRGLTRGRSQAMNMDGLDVVISEMNKFGHGDCIDHQIIGILRYG